MLGVISDILNVRTNLRSIWVDLGQEMTLWIPIACLILEKKAEYVLQKIHFLRFYYLYKNIYKRLSFDQYYVFENIYRWFSKQMTQTVATLVYF